MRLAIISRRTYALQALRSRFSRLLESNTICRVTRILLVIPTLDRSGAEKQLTLLATRLPRPEFSVQIVALTRAGPYAADLQQAGIPLTVLGKRFKCDPFTFFRLKRLIKSERPDVLHTWLFAANSYGRLAAGSRPPFKIVVSERCVDSWKSGWQLALDRRLVSRTTRLVGNSNGVADFYRGLGVPNDRLAVVHNGIDLPAIPDSARAEMRRQLGIADNALVVGYIGRLARQKRLEDLIWAFELIRVQHEHACFVIVGDGPERAKLEQFANNLRIGDHVRFLGHRDDAQGLLPAFNLFWLASDFEGFSNSIMEAMAAGLPVVASDIPPNRELVVHGGTGNLAPVGDRVAFAQLAQRLLLDPNLARQFGTAGRNRVASEFSVQRMVDGYVRIYREVVA
ncbi:MAG: glycosyltransferase [Planctomycetia bacterium]|nr:glycosyltransferase [Planctomycetia bacterium]